MKPFLSLTIILGVNLNALPVWADERDFEPRMNSYSVKRASDIDIVSRDDVAELRMKALFREEFKKHVLSTMAECIENDPIVRKNRTNSDIRIFYQILSDGNSSFDYRSSVNNQNILKLFRRLNNLLNKGSFCQIPESQGEAFGGWVSLPELLQGQREVRILPKDFFVKSMGVAKPKQGLKMVRPADHMAAPIF
ncbi:MAG: hypothetical protein K2X77_10125 [Candidatus Obscuribacterales bacterium]|jgi:hypothetical protein|nr:hypothetical protein [Candidatus Obscuribacterales bacterium]